MDRVSSPSAPSEAVASEARVSLNWVTRFALTRPVALTALFLLILGLSAMAVVRLPVSLLPDLRFPSFVVWTSYPAGAPNQVEDRVTRIVEDALAGTPGLRRMASRSLTSGSLVRLDLSWNQDLEASLIDLREQLDQVRPLLPPAASKPLLLQVDPSRRPLHVIAIAEAGSGGAAPIPRSDSHRLRRGAIKKIAQEVVARRLEQISGVARVRVSGGDEEEIRIDLLVDRLSELGIAVGDVSAALQASNFSLAGGLIRRGPYEYAIEVEGVLEGPEDIGKMVVGNIEGVPVRLEQIANVTREYAPRHGLARLDGMETLLLLVELSSDANALDVAREARQTLGELRRELPGVQIDVVVDESRFISAAVGNAVQALILGGFLSLLGLVPFLHQRHLLLAVAVAPPLALALALVLFDLFGVGFNLISLGGLVLGIGLLVDNAIVVVESIARRLEVGQEPFAAALEGAREVAGPITASTLTTLVVFLPLGFADGLAGRLFRDQSFAVVTSCTASLLVALTAVPALVRRGRERINAPRWLDPWHRTHERWLQRMISHRGAALACILVGILAAAGGAALLPREPLPPGASDRTVVRVSVPSGLGLEVLDERSRRLETHLGQLPGVRHVLAELGENATGSLELKPRPTHEGDVSVVLAEAQDPAETAAALKRLALPPDLAIEVRPVQSQLADILQGGGPDLRLQIIAPSRDDADKVAHRLEQALRGEPKLANVVIANGDRIPVYRFAIRRNEAMRAEVPTHVVSSFLETTARGRLATNVRGVSREVPVVLRVPGISRVDQLLNSRVPGGSGPVPLREVVEVSRTEEPSLLLREGREPVVEVTADLAPGVPLQEALAAVKEVAAPLTPPTARLTIRGANESFRTIARSAFWSLATSIFLVYLILCAQFESLSQPLIVLTSVPLALGGVVLALGAGGMSWNLMSLTGCVVLVGLVVNDAILKVDAMNRHRMQGSGLVASAVLASRDRFRAILMTTLTTSLALLPMALGVGEGAAVRAPLAVAVIGGLLVATILSLTVVPFLYVAIEGWNDKVAGRVST